MRFYPLAYEIFNGEATTETHIDFHTSEVKCKKARADLNRKIALNLEPRVGRILTVYPIEIPLKKPGVFKLTDFVANTIRGGIDWVGAEMMACDARGEEVL